MIRKKNIAIILFVVSAFNLISNPITLIVFLPLWDCIGTLSATSRVGITPSVGVGLVAAIRLIIVGINVYIKFQNE